MSTRSWIGRLKEDGEVEAIYCYFDGYVDSVGKGLLGNYQSDAKVEALIELGAISSLGPEIGVKIGFENLTGEERLEQCVAYHRDRGEPLEVEKFSSVTAYRDTALKDVFIEYTYLWKDGAWDYFGEDLNDWQPLAEAKELQGEPA